MGRPCRGGDGKWCVDRVCRCVCSWRHRARACLHTGPVLAFWPWGCGPGNDAMCPACWRNVSCMLLALWFCLRLLSAALLSALPLLSTPIGSESAVAGLFVTRWCACTCVCVCVCVYVCVCVCVCTPYALWAVCEQGEKHTVLAFYTMDEESLNLVLKTVQR